MENKYSLTPRTFGRGQSRITRVESSHGPQTPSHQVSSAASVTPSPPSPIYKPTPAPTVTPPKPGQFSDDDDEDFCKICDRNKTLVICGNCGYSFQGRKRIICNKHPMMVFLMDQTSCSECKNGNLIEVAGSSAEK